MRRAFLLALVLALVMLLIPAGTAFAKGSKVDVCHVNSSSEVFELGTWSFYFGKVITVSEKAADRHVEKRGDSLTFFPLNDFLIEFFGEAVGNGDCFFWTT